ncbi:deoxynucleoside triphosphate triphosphohydrolase SAMHD1-like isoform X2 [Physella acuta]|uniref:deoxynucleoside triphosphate triphosphohydrolase SAMHD1-like isoform X2 n=1 Tax=Physella acuta TaxID=109671 RepID=UPI0027DC1C21|nr:deoxynucleoside triphosphate triphosphohydrolase SAMHD1-like isoform X2 [Physella acuta]
MTSQQSNLELCKEKMKTLKVPDELIEQFKNADDLRSFTIEKAKAKSEPPEFKNYLDIVQVREENLGQKEQETLKVYNDPVHGHIQTNRAHQCIVDTPEFQRLRFIKQLGMVYFVFPGATHNRFEHSLGSCHLAGQFVKLLRKNQPYLGITDTDVLCVEIAALCRDLGQGMLSNFFYEQLLPCLDNTGSTKLEDMSVAMFGRLKNGPAGTKLKEKHFLDERDFTFIEEQIRGSGYENDGTWPCKGRGKEKAYLYEIAFNKRNGIDVDVFDSIARDCHHSGIKNNFDCLRYMNFARAMEVDGQMQICMKREDAGNLYNMMYTLYTLHRNAYQHRIKCAIDAMVLHALEMAKDFIFLANEKETLSKCVNGMGNPPEMLDAFMDLTDNVISKIRYSESPELLEAKTIIENIFKRKLYTLAQESDPMNSTQLSKGRVDELQNLLASKGLAKSYIVQVTQLKFGAVGNDPVEKLNVYTADNLLQSTTLAHKEVGKILGRNITDEVIVRVFSCVVDNKGTGVYHTDDLQELKAVWDEWVGEVSK